MTVQPTKFKSSKHLLFQLILFGLPVLLSVTFLVLLAQEIYSLQNDGWTTLGKIIFYLALIYAFWWIARAFQHTEYIITGDKLTYKSGFSRGEIPISQIKAIRESSYLTTGNRPALDLKGVEITYGDGYSIFLSPERKEEFVELVQRLRNENGNYS